MEKNIILFCLGDRNISHQNYDGQSFFYYETIKEADLCFERLLNSRNGAIVKTIKSIEI